MKKVFKENGMDILAVLLTFLSIHFYLNGSPKLSMLVLNIVLIPFVLLSYTIIKYMVKKKKLYIQPILSTVIEKRDDKLFFFLRNLTIYTVYLYLINKMINVIGTVPYGDKFNNLMITYICIYVLVIMFTLFYEFLVVLGFFKGTWIDKEYAKNIADEQKK